MSELFDSGRVGTNHGTREEIIDRWKGVGLLDLMEEDFREIFALKSEEVAYIVINAEDGTYKHDLSTPIIPCLGRVIKRINEAEKLTLEEKLTIIESIDAGEFISTIHDNLDSAIKLLDDIHGEGRRLFDFEAEMLSMLSENVAHKYLFRFYKFRKYKRDFYTLYSLVGRRTQEIEWLAETANVLGIELDEHNLISSDEDYAALEREYIRQEESKL